MIKLPENTFIFIAFGRSLSTLIMPEYIYQMGLVPCLIESMLHIFLAIQAHSIFVYYAEKINTIKLSDITLIVLGKKWQQALNILAFTNFQGLITVHITQFKSCVHFIQYYFQSNNIVIECTIYSIIFILQIGFFQLNLDHFKKIQIGNILAYLIIIISVIILSTLTYQNNILDNLFHTPELHYIPQYFNSNNMSYQFLIQMAPFLVIDQYKVQNKKLLNISILSHFLFYFTFGICAYMSIDFKIENENSQNLFFDGYKYHNIPSLILSIIYIYICLWLNGIYYCHAKEYFQSFMINKKVKNYDPQNKNFRITYDVISSIIYLVYYISAEKYEPLYQLLTGNISYFFFSIILPYNLRYNQKLSREKKRRGQDQIQDRPTQQGKNKRQNSENITSSVNMRNSQNQQILNTSNQNLKKDTINLHEIDSNEASQEQQIFNQIVIIEDNISNEKNDQQPQNNDDIYTCIRFKQQKERNKKILYWINGILLFIGYIMSIILIIYFFYSQIYENTQKNQQRQQIQNLNQLSDQLNTE